MQNFSVACELLATGNGTCVSAGNATYSDIPEGWSTICPYPLRIPAEGVPGIVHSVAGTACAFPCPSVSRVAVVKVLFDEETDILHARRIRARPRYCQVVLLLRGCILILNDIVFN
jgi:hypothetical protein